LAAALRAAAGIIVSSPVYFGDSGSLFEFIASDPSLKQDMAGKIYGGPLSGRREMAVKKRR
jgi:hypothetical protein